MKFKTPLWRAILHEGKTGHFLSLNFGSLINEECQSFIVQLKAGTGPEKIVADLRNLADRIENYDHATAVQLTRELTRELTPEVPT